MKINLNASLVLFIICIVMGATVFFLWKDNSSLRKDNKTLNGNIDVLNTGIEKYRTENGVLVTKVGEIQTNYKQLEKYNADIVKKLESMDVRTKKIESVISEKTRTYYVIKDSLRLRDSIINNLKSKCFDYNDDKHIRMTGCVADVDESTTILVPGTATVEVIDSSYAVVNPIPYKFWFIKFGTKSVELQILHTNPYINTTDLQYYDLKKKKRK